MLKLCVLADDLTGALDTGVQFARAGVRTAVAVGTQPPADCAVAVCDLETRHVSPEAARSRTREAAEAALRCGAATIYIKTDSGLRGNIGAELAALLDLSPDAPVLFAPAFPAHGRVTRGGVQWIDGVPVSGSLFGRDPLTPVLRDRAADILRCSADLPELTELAEGDPIPEDAHGVLIADAESDEALSSRAAEGIRCGITRFAGCAGFAKALAGALRLKKGGVRRGYRIKPMLVVCGSVSPVSYAQLARLREFGVPCFGLSDTAEPDAVFDAMREFGCAVAASSFSEADRLANDRRGETAESVAARLGALAARAARDTDCSLFLIGGDTLMAAVRAMGDCSVEPFSEAESGVVLSMLRAYGTERLLVTKSGSFGGPDTAVDVVITSSDVTRFE